MPVLKNPYKLKMANGEATSPGTLILEKDSQGSNPFEEDLEENERDFFLGSSSPSHGIPSSGGGSEFGGDLFNGSPEGRYRRRATLEKLVGLSPFRLSKGKKEKSPSGEKGSDRRSFLGRLMIPLAEGNQDHRSPEKRKTRRSSEDFSLLQLLNGRRKESLCSLDCGLAEKENGGGSDTMKRMSFLKIGLGAKVRRASLVEKSSQAEAPEPVPITGEVEPKVKEPLSESGFTHRRFPSPQELLVRPQGIHLPLRTKCSAVESCALITNLWLLPANPSPGAAPAPPSLISSDLPGPACLLRSGLAGG